jgi:replication initiation protein RepC
MQKHISDAGTRRITPEIVRGRQLAREGAAKFVSPENKFDVLRDVKRARQVLGLSPIALQVLDIFVGLLRPADTEPGNQPVVRPSNAYLQDKTGYSLRAIQRAFKALIKAGLILEKRSANGKRYARKAADGRIKEAFGFDLSPLFGRAGEIRSMAMRVDAEREALREARQDITRYRVAIEAELAAASRDQANSVWQQYALELETVLGTLPYRPDLHDMEAVIIKLQRLNEIVENIHNSASKHTKMTPNECQNDTHIQNTNPDADFLSSHKRSDAYAPQHNSQNATYSGKKGLAKKPVPAELAPQVLKPVSDPNIDLPLVFYACPAVEQWAKGACRNWDTFVTSAQHVLFPLLGIGQHAWAKAVNAMGERHAAVATVLVLERQEANQIQTTAGAYFTAMIDRAREGELRLHASLMKLAKERENE